MAEPGTRRNWFANSWKYSRNSFWVSWKSIISSNSGERKWWRSERGVAYQKVLNKSRGSRGSSPDPWSRDMVRLDDLVCNTLHYFKFLAYNARSWKGSPRGLRISRIFHNCHHFWVRWRTRKDLLLVPVIWIAPRYGSRRHKRGECTRTHGRVGNEGIEAPKPMGFHILDGQEGHGSITYFVFWTGVLNEGMERQMESTRCLKATITAQTGHKLWTPPRIKRQKKGKFQGHSLVVVAVNGTIDKCQNQNPMNAF